jgi:hypothetical protein
MSVFALTQDAPEKTLQQLYFFTDRPGDGRIFKICKRCFQILEAPFQGKFGWLNNPHFNTLLTIIGLHNLVKCVMIQENG